MSNTMTLVSGANSIEISVPVFGYTTIIDFPFTIQELSKGLWHTRDEGTAYDMRVCECDVVLDSTEIADLQDFLSDKARTSSSTVLTPGTGFHPFGPDKGDEGPFTVAMEMISAEGIGEAPLGYFTRRLRMVNQSTWPSYSLPTQVSEGGLTVGTITNCRFPPSWFRPKVNYDSHMSVGMNAAALFVDQSADRFETVFGCVMNESKAAAVLNHLTVTARGNTFSLITGENMYAFDYDKGTDTTHTVRLLNNIISVKHIRHDRFDFDLHLGWES